MASKGHVPVLGLRTPYLEVPSVQPPATTCATDLHKSYDASLESAAFASPICKPPCPGPALRTPVASHLICSGRQGTCTSGLCCLAIFSCAQRSPRRKQCTIPPSASALHLHLHQHQHPPILQISIATPYLCVSVLSTARPPSSSLTPSLSLFSLALFSRSAIPGDPLQTPLLRITIIQLPRLSWHRAGSQHLLVPSLLSLSLSISLTSSSFSSSPYSCFVFRSQLP